MTISLHQLHAGPHFQATPIDPDVFQHVRSIAGCETLGQDSALYQALIVFRDAPAQAFDFRARVIYEKTELDIKATALSKFIGESQVFATLDPAEQDRLKEQCEVMWQYSEILGARIAAFQA